MCLCSLVLFRHIFVGRLCHEVVMDAAVQRGQHRVRVPVVKSPILYCCMLCVIGLIVSFIIGFVISYVNCFMFYRVRVPVVSLFLCLMYT